MCENKVFQQSMETVSWDNSNRGGSSHRSEARGGRGREKQGSPNFHTRLLRKWERKGNGTFLNEKQNQNYYLRKVRNSVLFNTDIVCESCVFSEARSTFPPAHLSPKEPMCFHTETKPRLRIKAGSCTQKAKTKPNKFFPPFSEKGNLKKLSVCINPASLKTSQIGELMGTSIKEKIVSSEKALSYFS